MIQIKNSTSLNFNCGIIPDPKNSRATSALECASEIDIASNYLCDYY